MKITSITEELKHRSITSFCEYLLEFCDLYINPAGSFYPGHAQSLYSALPTILTQVFGSPTTRGWIQTETRPGQDACIRRLLSAEGAFIKALMRLSSRAELSYDMISEKLPEDVRKALAAGAIQFLPRLYNNCVYLEKKSNTASIDFRASATRQSTIFPRPVSGEQRIRFNMIQFYLYYMISVPTWPPLTTTSSASMFSNFPKPPLTSKTTSPVSYLGTSTQSTNSYSTSSMSGTITPIAPQSSPMPRTRTIMCSIYDEVVEEYMDRFIGCVRKNKCFHPVIGTFFLDACIELWIRTPWISFGQKLSTEFMHFITLFVKFVVSGDLRRCYFEESPSSRDPITQEYTMVYDSIKDELYMLISRLALNWAKQDDYLQVISLWSVWAAPWRRGSAPRSFEAETHQPLLEGWAPFILDNVLYYLPLVEIFLQHMSTFNYASKSTSDTPPVPTSSFQSNQIGPAAATASTTIAPSTNNGKIGDQLRILYRLINVLKARGVVEFLSLIEQALVGIQADATESSNGFPIADSIDIITNNYLKSSKREDVFNSLTRSYDTLVQLGGGSWQPPNLYIQKAPRAEPLVKTLNALQQASEMRQDVVRLWGAHGTASRKAGQHMQELDKAANIMTSLFSLPLSSVKQQQQAPSTTTTRSLMSALQQHKTAKESLAATTKGDDEPPRAGLRKGGFLTEEEKRLVRQGKMCCSHRNIPVLGPRAEEIVRSYEIMTLVRWIVPFDRWMNKHYHRLIPPGTPYLPDRLTVRPLASRINLIYFTLILFVIYIVS